jgi:hypothetical protein
VVYIPNAGFGTYTAIDIPAGGIAISRTLPVVSSLIPKTKMNMGVVTALYGPSLHLALFMMGNHQCSPFYLELSLIHTLVSPILDKTPPVWDPVSGRTRDPRASMISDRVGYSFKPMLSILAGEVLFVSYREQ